MQRNHPYTNRRKLLMDEREAVEFRLAEARGLVLHFTRLLRAIEKRIDAAPKCTADRIAEEKIAQ